MMISPPSIAEGELRDFFASQPLSLPTDPMLETAAAGPFKAFQRIVEITADVFGQKPIIQSHNNPEFPDERWIVLTVELPPDIAFMLEKEAVWTRQVAAIEPKLDMVRLSVKPQK